MRSAAMRLGMCIALSLGLTTGAACQPNHVNPPPLAAISVLPCQEVIGSSSAPRTDESVVFDRVALPTGRVLQAFPSSATDSTPWLFAKNGLLIRRGMSFDLIIPEGLQGGFAIGWGSPGPLTRHLRIPGCQPTHTLNPIRESDQWLAYAGGYYVKEPACVSLSVKAGQETQTVQIGVGTPCPGQSPPPPI
jgi:hypothetical protein